MLILEAVKIIKKDRCESPFLPFAYHKIMYPISNLVSDYPPQWSLLPPRGFLRLKRRGRLLCSGDAVLPALSCRWQSCPSEQAPLPPCQQHKGMPALQLFNAFCILKRKRWASSLAIFSRWHYLITQPVSLNQETYLVSEPGGQQVPWSIKISKF